MTEINFVLPNWVILVGMIVLLVVIYSVIAGIISGLFERFWPCMNGGPPSEITGVVWPMTLVFLAGYLALIVLWWTVLLPARLVYKAIVK